MKTKAGLSLLTLSLIALLLMCGLAASAQDQVTQPPTTSAVPNLIRYGGVLKDANGAVFASQTLGVTFALYKQQDGGVALWTETRNVITNAAGQYSVMLGSTKSEGVSADLFSEQEQRWLGVQVQGQPEQSRVLMVSVPYAFQAHEAETLGGLPPSAFVKAPSSSANSTASTNVGSGAVGNNTAAVIVPQSSGSTAAQDGAWARTGTTVQLSTDTDKVGVGTSTPKVKLDVSGDIHASGKISSGNATVTMNGLENAITVDNVPPTPPGKASELYLGGENALNTIPFSTIKLGLATKSISGDSKFSIFDPQLPSLDILTTFASGSMARAQLAVSTFNSAYSIVAVPGDVVLRADADTGINSKFTATKSLILAARNNNGGAIRFVTGLNAPFETEKMTLLSGGNFGIGNTMPPQLLSVGPGPLNSPFEVNSGGDMVFIKNVAYSWPSLPQPALNQVLTVVSAGSVAGLGWQAASNVITNGNGVTSTSKCTPNFLPKWLTGTNNVGCSEVFDTGALVDINTTVLDPDSRLSIFDSSHPALDIFTTLGSSSVSKARAQLAVSTFPGAYSLVSVPGDVVLRADADYTFGATKSLILAARSKSGAIRFATGIYSPSETEKMTLLSGGNFGIGNTLPPQLLSVGPGALNSPFEVNSGGDMVFIKNVAYSWPIIGPTTGQVLTSIAASQLGWTTITTGGGNVNGNCGLNYNYLTKWVPPFVTQTTTVDCSHVWENDASYGMTAYFVGIGTTTPTTALEVGGVGLGVGGGEITADFRYDITGAHSPVLSIDNGPIGSISAGDANLFVGVGAGASNTSSNGFGQHNTLVGYNAGTAVGTGGGDTSYNTFLGDSAGVLYANVCPFPQSCGGNTFVGTFAASREVSGTDNTAVGGQAGSGNFNGSFNIFLGSAAGGNPQSSGSNDIYIGVNAAAKNDSGNSNNIYLGSQGCLACQESSVIRIGNYLDGTYTQQNKVFIEPILATTVTNGANVFINTATGQLSVSLSSRRFKEQIADMGDSTSKLLQLRPVTFLYKPQYDDGSRTLQYGLIAEEVAKVDPDMVAYDKEGQPYTVKYQMLAPMLLNEFQKQHAVVTAQQTEVQALREQTKAQQQQMLAQQQEIEGLKSQLQLQNAAFQERLSRLESLVTTQMQTAADKPTPATTSAPGGLQ